MSNGAVPPLPQGYQLDSTATQGAVPPPPSGYTLDSATPAPKASDDNFITGVAHKAGEWGQRFVHGVGLPTTPAELRSMFTSPEDKRGADHVSPVNLLRNIGEGVASEVHKGNVLAPSPIVPIVRHLLKGEVPEALGGIQQGVLAGMGGEVAAGEEAATDFVRRPSAPPVQDLTTHAKALDAALPAKSGVNVAKEIATPETVGVLRDTAARMQVQPGDLNGANATATLRNVVGKARIENNTLFHRYLDPAANVPALDMTPVVNAVRSELTPALEAVDPTAARAITRLADRLSSTEATIGDLDQMRQFADGKLKAIYESDKPYSPALADALKRAASVIRDIEYQQLEALHNLPPGSLRSLKLQQGALLELEPLVKQLDAEVSKLASKEASRTGLQKAGAAVTRQVGRIRAVGNPEQAAALAAQELSRIPDTARLLQQVFKGLGRPRPFGTELPPPRQITLRSSLPSPLSTPYNARAATQAVRPQVGGDQAMSGRPPVASETPIEAPTLPPTLAPSSRTMPASMSIAAARATYRTPAEVMEAAKNGTITPQQANVLLKGMGQSREVRRMGAGR